MFTCKQVSNALSEHDYASLSPLRRAGLKLHVALCIVCGRYNRQVMFMQDTVRTFRDREEAIAAKPGTGRLSDEDKEALKEALRRGS